MKVGQAFLGVLPLAVVRLRDDRLQGRERTLRDLRRISEPLQVRLALADQLGITKRNRRIESVNGLERVSVRADLRRAPASAPGHKETGTA